MENMTEAIYMAAGGIIFALAVGALLYVNRVSDVIYNEAMYNNSKDEILWWVTDE